MAEYTFRVSGDTSKLNTHVQRLNKAGAPVFEKVDGKKVPVMEQCLFIEGDKVTCDDRGLAFLRRYEAQGVGKVELFEEAPKAKKTKAND